MQERANGTMLLNKGLGLNMMIKLMYSAPQQEAEYCSKELN